MIINIIIDMKEKEREIKKEEKEKENQIEKEIDIIIRNLEEKWIEKKDIKTNIQVKKKKVT